MSDTVEVGVPAASETATKTEVVESKETPVVNKPLDKSRAARLQELENAWREGKALEKETKEEVKAEEKPVVQETKTVEDPLKEDQADEFTKRFAQLSKKEQQLRDREAKLKERDAELEELRQLREWKALAKKDPLKFAQDAQLSLKDLADQSISGEKFNERIQAQELAERLKKLEEMTETQKKEEAKRTADAQARAYVEKINANIDAAAGKYELVKEVPGGKQLVINTIAEYYQSSGEEMPWDQAAQLCEDYLLDQKTKELNALLKLEKIKGKLNMPKAEPVKQETKPTVPAGIKTISNNTASAPVAREVGKTTREERERRIKELAANLFTE